MPVINRNDFLNIEKNKPVNWLSLIDKAFSNPQIQKSIVGIIEKFKVPTKSNANISVIQNEEEIKKTAIKLFIENSYKINPNVTIKQLYERMKK